MIASYCLYITNLHIVKMECIFNLIMMMKNYLHLHWKSKLECNVTEHLYNTLFWIRSIPTYYNYFEWEKEGFKCLGRVFRKPLVGRLCMLNPHVFLILYDFRCWHCHQWSIKRIFHLHKRFRNLWTPKRLYLHAMGLQSLGKCCYQNKIDELHEFYCSTIFCS